MRGIDLPHGTYVNICGTDIVRDEHGAFLVLEDNARDAIRRQLRRREPAHDAARLSGSARRDRPAPDRRLRAKLIAALREVAPAGVDDPRVVLLSPGTYNSAYFEHVFLAREMGVPLVEGSDLVVEDDRVYMRTTGGLARVDVIYRRIDDDYLDPEAFLPDSMLGVPGLMRAYRAGNVALANAVGTGVADDKAVYAYMPRIIRYYLGAGPDPAQRRDPHLPRAGRRLRYTLDHLDRAGGQAGRRGRRLRHHGRPARRAGRSSRMPRRSWWPTRPTTSASPASSCRSRRPWSTGRSSRATSICGPLRSPGRAPGCLPGGLTRVALRRGSLVVNSSQGGGSKDTWVLA